jgi:hypothetical protein
MLRLDDKCIELGCAMARSGQLPCHWLPCVGIHVEVESQVRDTVLRKVQVKSETCGAFVTLDVETLKLSGCGVDKVWMDMRGSNAWAISNS